MDLGPTPPGTAPSPIVDRFGILGHCSRWPGPADWVRGSIFGMPLLPGSASVSRGGVWRRVRLTTKIGSSTAGRCRAVCCNLRPACTRHPDRSADLGRIAGGMAAEDAVTRVSDFARSRISSHASVIGRHGGGQTRGVRGHNIQQTKNNTIGAHVASPQYPFVLIAIAGPLLREVAAVYNKAFLPRHPFHWQAISEGKTPQGCPPVTGARQLDMRWIWRAIWRQWFGFVTGSALKDLRIGRGCAPVGAADARSVHWRAYGDSRLMCTVCAPGVIGLRRAKASASAAVAFWCGQYHAQSRSLGLCGFVWAGDSAGTGLACAFVGLVGLWHRIMKSPQLPGGIWGHSLAACS